MQQLRNIDISKLEKGRICFVKWRNEPGWPVEYISNNIFEILGYTSEQLISGEIKYSDLILADDLQHVENEVTAAIAAGLDEFSHDIYRLKHQDNSVVYIYDHTRIVRDQSGQVSHFLGYLVNDTSHVTQTTRLELVLQGTGLGLWDWNPQTNDVVFDEGWANMLGYSLDEIEPTLESWSSRVHPDDINICYDDIQKHMDGKTDAYRNIHRMKHRDGTWVYIWDRGKIVEWDAHGKPIRFTGTHTDITESKQLEHELIAQSNAKESFFALMSHELRTPMNAILGFADLLSEGENLTDSQHHDISIIQAQTRSLLTILNDILDYSKINTGNILFEHVPFNLRQVCAGIKETMTQMLDERSSTLHIDIDAAISENILGDEVRVGQIITNYISNAIKFSSGDVIELIASISDDTRALNIEVTDHGIGISKENQQKLFTPFVQEDDSTTRHFGGTGLGLSLCKLLAQGMGGDVYLKSTKGKGSTFGFTLPYSSTLKAVTSDKQAAQISIENMHVLLVEDNAVNQQLGCAYLKKSGVAYDLAENGKIAIEKCRNNDYDIILMDMQMPVMNGLEAARHLTFDFDFNTPIIALTANATAESKKACKEAGMCDFVTKPYNHEQLARILHKWSKAKLDD